MSITSNLFQSAADQFIQGNAQWKAGGHTLKMALLTSTAAPNLSTWSHFSDVTNEITGTGYTAGGQALTSLTNTETAANSWGTTRANSTSYNVGDIVRPATGNGFLYVCVVAGTSGAGLPTYSTVVGQDTTDGTVTWDLVGESITVYSSAAVSWTSSTITARYGVIYDPTTGVATTEPLIALINFGVDESDTAGTFTITPPSSGWFFSCPS